MNLRYVVFTIFTIFFVVSNIMAQPVPECGGVSYPGDTYPCCSNGGNCTWWAYAQRPDLEDLGIHGNGEVWWTEAQEVVETNTTPLVGSIVGFSGSYFPNVKEGHVAFVRYVHDDGSFWVSEMNCCTDCAGGVSFKKYTHTDQGFIYGGPVPYNQTKSPTELINDRRSTPLNDRNPYGWPDSPESEFEAFTSEGWWFEFLNYDPHVYNQTDGTAKNCYLSMNNSGQNPTAGIVYDALGGALYAYTVGWEQWSIWNGLDPDCEQTPESREGGPNSCLGMPITNLYRAIEGQEIWRQDFQKGYIENGSIKGYTKAVCAPGWASGEIWNSRYSYLFADAYDRNGAARDVGNAQDRVLVLCNDILYQPFSGGNNGDGWIVYDQKNFMYNPLATNEAYYIYGDFWRRYTETTNPDNGLSGAVGWGFVTRDRYQWPEGSNTWRMDFVFPGEGSLDVRGHYMLLDPNDTENPYNISWHCLGSEVVTQYPAGPPDVLTLQPNEAITCWVDFRNNNINEYWDNIPGSQHYVELRSVNQAWNGDQSSELAYNWLDGGGYRIATSQGQVDPGSIERYSFQIMAPSIQGVYDLRMRLHHGIGGYIHDDNAEVTIRVDVVESGPDLSHGLVAYWSFDDATASDNSGNGNAWVKPDVNNDYMKIIGKSIYSNAQSEEYALDITPNLIGRMSIKRNSGCEPLTGWYNSPAQTVLQQNQWDLLTGTWDGNTLKLYLNGLLQSTNNNVPLGSIDDCLGGTLRIGLWWENDPAWFHGTIDEVRIYNRALSDEEVLTLYNNIMAPNTAFFDDFEDGDDIGWSSRGFGTWEVENGAYVFECNGSNQWGKSVAGNADWADYTIDVDIRGTYGIDKQVWIREQHDCNTYAVILRRDRYNDILLVKYIDCVEQFRKSFPTPTPIYNGQWYHLTIAVIGDRITTSVDGVLVLDYTDESTELTHGRIGLGGYIHDGSYRTRWIVPY